MHDMNFVGLKVSELVGVGEKVGSPVGYKVGEIVEKGDGKFVGDIEGE